MSESYLGISLEDVYTIKETKCSYRNCQNYFYKTKSSHIYCCEICRCSENVYLKRDKKIKKPVGRPKGKYGPYKEKKLGDEIIIKKNIKK